MIKIKMTVSVTANSMLAGVHGFGSLDHAPDNKLIRTHALRSSAVQMLTNGDLTGEARNREVVVK